MLDQILSLIILYHIGKITFQVFRLFILFIFYVLRLPYNLVSYIVRYIKRYKEKKTSHRKFIKNKYQIDPLEPYCLYRYGKIRNDLVICEYCKDAICTKQISDEVYNIINMKIHL